MTDFREEALSEGIPVIREDTEALLSFLAVSRRPERILEIGTAVGYSGTVMLLSAAEAKLTTIELDEERAGRARENFARFGLSDRVRILRGDAAEILPSLSGTYPLIFLDGAKAQYLVYLPELLRLLPEGGLLVADDLFQDGDELESHFIIRRRDRTIHKRLRDFLKALRDDGELETILLPVGDGVSLTTRKGRT